MNCSELSSLARKGQLAEHSADPDVLAHLRQCGACEALFGAGDVGQLLANGAEAPEFDLAGMRGELERMLEAEARQPAARVRGLSTRARIWTFLSVVSLTLGVVAAVWLRGNWQSYPAARMWLTLVSLAVALVVVVRELFRPLTSLERPGYQLAVAFGAVVLPMVFALMPHDVAALAVPANAVSAAGTCLGLGLAFALPSVAFMLLGLRIPITQAAGLEPRSLWLGAALAGLVGNLGLQVHCAFTDSGHLLFGHAASSLIWFGGLVAWSRWRARV